VWSADGAPPSHSALALAPGKSFVPDDSVPCERNKSPTACAGAASWEGAHPGELFFEQHAGTRALIGVQVGDADDRSEPQQLEIR
jgi:hypothetical protein